MKNKMLCSLFIALLFIPLGCAQTSEKSRSDTSNQQGNAPEVKEDVSYLTATIKPFTFNEGLDEADLIA
ncbi:hypothetical protein [Alkalihalobacillus pseudalcaliphilus]|uniref:hypothetical protein n=1 Tax=Alkalihalobacillus pseudalcaliphilus TaxID=79884 RepID=UPI00064DE1BB|nr:hypothetical protein [Alkalihalobacillus pseudalcaliphilus]KMK75799.1 hypothetical protein AB990_11055 [Alkalihalobacillus pseudalcaliphilus]